MWAEVSDKGKPVKSRDTAAILNDYFNISTDTIKLYEDWSSRDDHFKNKSIKYLGIRVLRQDPWENLCSFICSSNNNVKRISQLVQKMTITFGDHVATLDDLKIHSFPSPDKLADTEPILRELGLGYRAKYISKTAEMLLTKPGGEQFLHELRDASLTRPRVLSWSFLGWDPRWPTVCVFSV